MTFSLKHKQIAKIFLISASNIRIAQDVFHTSTTQIYIFMLPKIFFSELTPG